VIDFGVGKPRHSLKFSRMKTVHAIYANGVFRPRERVDLPESSEVEFEPRTVSANPQREAALSSAYEVLAERYTSGERDVAARHNEHQP
jgi:predicted DNA-binding antitoxin AbrB/MazE fold protein